MNEYHVTYGENYARKNHPHSPMCYLRIVGFPCNQFGLQEPAHNDEILNGLKYVRPGHGFVPRFNMTSKIEVNGKNENNVFKFLKSRCPAPGGIVFTHTNYDVSWRPVRSNDVAWNFQKWLIDSEGRPQRRYESDYTPEMMKTDIENQIAECVKKSGKTKRITKEEDYRWNYKY